MKIYSIGRENGCDVIINDNTDVISRRHAILSVDSRGKMTITDQSHNGTYVNGIRLASNVAVPVTRKDNVSFAQIARLDWQLIPDPTSIYKYIILSVIGVVAAVLIGWGLYTVFGNNSEEEPQEEIPSEQEISQEEIERCEKARQDSISQAIRDSINRANKKKQNHPRKPEKTKTNPVKKEDKQPAQEVQTRIR